MKLCVTNLGRSQTSLGKLVHLILNLLRSSLQPGRRSSLVRQRGLRNSLTTGVHASHLYMTVVKAMKF